jgi:endonuclease/exonuclease/phosphatase family metal-dependent hydrolase
MTVVHRVLLFATIVLLGAALGMQQRQAGRSQDAPDKAANTFGRSKPLPRTPGSVRIATYNMLNLFDGVDDPALQGEFDDIKFPTPPDRLKNMAAAIRQMDADIVALQEVESRDALLWFRDTYLADMGYQFVSSLDVGYYRGVECSVLSRYKITREHVAPRESLDDVRRTGEGWAPRPSDIRQPMRFQRSPLIVDIDVSAAYALTLIVVHHKSAAQFDYQREAEALQIVEYIDELRRLDPGRNIVVLGDCNAAPWDKSVRTYLEAGMIDTLAHRTTYRDEPETPLFKTHESDKVLDYIFLNSAAHRELVIGSAHVFGTLMPPPTYDWRTDPPPPGYASDHYPVMIELMPKDQP